MSSKNIKEAMYLELREDRAVNNIRERRQVEWPAVAAIDTVMVWLLLYLRGKKDHSSCCVETRLGERMAKESHWVFLKTQMRKDGNLIVMGNGESSSFHNIFPIRSQQVLLIGYIWDVRKGENTNISEIKY